MLFYKIVNGQVPDYLTELVPPTVADTNNYNLRNRLNISQPSYRLSTYQQSYFPTTIKLWNTLDLNLRQLPTLPSFKRIVYSPDKDSVYSKRGTTEIL